MPSRRNRWAPEVLRLASDDNDAGYVLGVADSPEASGWSLLFMEVMEGEECAEPGMDTYCLVVEPGQATHYGGVLECEVAEDQLRLLLTDEAAETLGVPVRMSFRLELPSEQVGLLRRGLGRVLTSGRPGSAPRLLAT